MATSRTQGFLIGCFLLLAVGAFAVVGMALLAGSSLTDGGSTWVGGDRLGMVLIEGPITDSRVLVEEIEAHRADASVKAVVLRLDSPGGEVAPSQEIHAAVERLSAVKPVVASFGSVAASGAYYIAVAADSILAEGGTLTGSIGVIFAYPTAVDLMDKVGVRMEVYKSGQLKDMGSYARQPTGVEDGVFDELVADVFDQFVTAVVDGRPLDRDQVLALADGRVFTGRQARELGLIDRLGDLHTATELAAAMAGLPANTTVVRKSRRRLSTWLDLFLSDTARATWGPRLEYRLR